MNSQQTASESLLEFVAVSNWVWPAPVPEQVQSVVDKALEDGSREAIAHAVETITPMAVAGMRQKGWGEDAIEYTQELGKFITKKVRAGRNCERPTNRNQI